MSFQIDALTNPAQTNKALYGKYSSSQTYYYSNIMSQIVKQKRTTSNITYQDMEYLCQTEQYLKRFYFNQQYPGKMFTFKEYYFYHQDCPRIFTKKIEDLYSRWQDRKRDLVYKKLKILYNESMSTSRSSEKEDDHKSTSGLQHFLLEISDYNPFSKKYYLRVQAKQGKNKVLNQSTSKNQQTKTVSDLSTLNHDLSVMLNDISQLSQISTLQQQQSPRFSSLYHSKKLKVNYSSESSTYHNSQSNSNIQSTIKFNFKKNKNSLSKEDQKIAQQLQQKIDLKDKSRQKSSKLIQIPTAHPPRLSPKFSDNKRHDKQLNTTYAKSKSIIQLSSFNPNRKSQNNMLCLNLNLNKKQSLKLKSDKKVLPRQNRISIENKPVRIYESEKKPIIKSQSQRKMPQIILNQQEKLLFQSLEKKSNAIMASSGNILKPIQRKNSLKEGIGNLNNQNKQQFSDSKFQNNGEVRFRSHKSQYFSLPKQNLLSRANSPSKISLKVNQQDKKYLNREKINVQIGKKNHQLKIQ